jgi:hypothetical protein
MADTQDVQEAQAVKARFSPEEWEQLVSAPMMVTFGVMLADMSGPIGMAQEMGKAATLLARVSTEGSPNALVQAVASEAVRSEKERGGAARRPSLDFEGKPPAEAQVLLVERLRAVDAVLEAKAAPDERAALRAFLLDVGRQVAAAAKEGTVLGFGGTRVSPQEQAVLQQMATALGGDASGSPLQ